MRGQGGRLDNKSGERARGNVSNPVPASDTGLASKLARDLALVRSLIRFRRARSSLFDPSMMADPAWDIILELTLARLEDRRTSTKAVSLASGLTARTANRWLVALEAQGWIRREQSDDDARVMLIALSDVAVAKVDTFLEQLDAN